MIEDPNVERYVLRTMKPLLERITKLEKDVKLLRIRIENHERKVIARNSESIQKPNK